MNQGRIWCVVNPTVGLPLFLGSVTLIALGVHAEVLSHTTWFSGYWQGKAGKTAQVLPAAPDAATAPGASVAPTAAPTTAPAAAPAVALLAAPKAPVATQ
jgi:light-harvesting protein B-800-850 alpha chain